MAAHFALLFGLRIGHSGRPTVTTLVPRFLCRGDQKPWASGVLTSFLLEID